MNANFSFDTAAGRYIVLSFVASTSIPFSKRLLELVDAQRDRFDVTNAIFFAVSIDPNDPAAVKQGHGGLVYFFDRDRKVSQQYFRIRPPGAADAAAQQPYEPATFVIDQGLRVLAVIPFEGTPESHLQRIADVLDALPRLSTLAIPAPALMIPYVFEPELCLTLIDYYDANGGEDSGFMRDVGGKTVAHTDYAHKRRTDCNIQDEALIRITQNRLHRRVIPAIRQAFQFAATRIERHIVACYDANDGGHFRAHRDNTTLGTAHRRFAVTLNLNSEDFDGGELWFPEFGPRKYKAPTGGCVVFSCSLLHEATKVTRGQRYAFLPFLYDDAAAAVRQRNAQYLSNGPATVVPATTPADSAGSGVTPM